MTEAQQYEAKFQEMQKYVPFIQRVIDKLKVNNEQQADNPRKAQLQKMEMLHDLLTNKAKKIKMETLLKCEGVLIKLHAKIEKNEDPQFSGIRLKQQQAIKPSLTSSKPTKVAETEDISGPASPPPEIVAEHFDQPVVIPTERRCSPILLKETVKIPTTKQMPTKDSKHSTSEQFQNLREKVFPPDHKNNRHQSQQEKECQQQSRTHYEARAQTLTQHHPATHLNSSRQNSPLPREKPAASNKLQKVKVVITEPLPAHVKTQHFPSSSKYMPRTSVCYNNLRTLPQAPHQTDETNEAYSPEELWEQYNESQQNKRQSNTPATPAVFSRLGIKVQESAKEDCVATTSSSKATTGRYTPIPDVLKSPPLSANDINNLLLESGADKIAHDISEIGCRRPPKVEDSNHNNNSFEFVRKKLAQTVRMSSPLPAAEKDESKLSPLPNERLALKYNPHPRQERLQSMSSTDGSECSTQTKVNDPRIKLKLQTNSSALNSPTQVAASNVNVLPAINFNDPRLKKQNFINQTATSSGRITVPSTPSPTQSSSTPTTSYGSLKDPRISRVAHKPSFSATQQCRASTNQAQQYSSEENWDSEPEEKLSRPTNKVDPRLAKREQTKVDNRFDSNGRNLTSKPAPNRRNSLSQSRHQMESDNNNRSLSQTRFQADARPADKPNFSKKDCEKEASLSKSCVQTKAPPALNKEPVAGGKTKKIRSRLLPAITHTINNPPKSDTEDDWDSEPEATTNIAQPETNRAVANKPTTGPPAIAPFPTHISPQAFVSPIHSLASPVTPVSMTPNPYNQLPYPLAAPHNHAFPKQHNAPANNRFSSVLNDKSERIKYFEAKKQKTVQPRTYKEFREARERAQAQEAALRRAADEAEAQKRAAELKEANKDKDVTAPSSDTHETPKDCGAQKFETAKNKDKKPTANEAAKPSTQTPKDKQKAPPPGESTLDKMYRTQNFNSSFPKSKTSFKIPKKKTEEKSSNSNVEAADKPKDTLNKPLENEVNKEKAKPCNQEIKKPTEPCNSKQVEQKETDKNQTQSQATKDKANHNKKQNEANNTKTLEAGPSDKTQEEKQQDNREATAKNKEQPKDKPETQTQKTMEDSASKTCDKPLETKEKLPETEQTVSEESTESSTENKEDKSTEDNKKRSRDPRCRTKAALTKDTEEPKETEPEHENDKEIPAENFKMFGDIVITSAENEVTLKPQQNLSALDKFNKLTQEINPKPQRVLRRRNTMVVFDSAPLVDKEKLRKANALLFEDVQDEEKRKRKKAEEERITARRNKHLEEMFKKTDDNCTVSTQNIITGKRRTRATINFNETANAINVFKHKTVKETASPSTSQATPPAKVTRSNVKTKIKHQTEDKSDDENSEISVTTRGSKTNKETKASKTKANKETKVIEEIKNEESQKAKQISETKTPKKRAAANKKSSSSKEEATTAANVTTEVGFKSIADDEHQNCAVSSTSTDTSAEEQASCSTSSNLTSFKKESDDNEPSSTANKSNNPTPTPEANVHVLNEIVDQILKPNADREHILGLLGQILSEERLELIKSLIENSNRQTEEQHGNKDETTEAKEVKEETNKSPQTNKEREEPAAEEDDEEEAGDEKPHKPKAAGGKRINKKKRTELDRLNEDIRDMFICEGVLTATGRRMCTIMGKEVETEADKTNKSSKETTISPVTEQEGNNKRKEKLKPPPPATRALRRSLRSCKTTEETEDDEALSILSRTTEESMEDYNTTTDTSSSTTTDTTPQRRMPVLKPHTPIKIPDEVSTKEAGNKRKAENKSAIKAKKAKTNEDTELQDNDKESETEEEAEPEQDDEQTPSNKTEIVLKNTSVHWHYQSKYTKWCMVCEKKIPTTSTSMHYKIHHGENYISRIAPVILQQLKQGKLNKPLFGVKKAQKQPSWFYRCPFCLKYFNTLLTLWLEHFQNHTVEFRYECSKCYRCSNRRVTVGRHIKNCEGATILTSVVKLDVPTVIKGHVCHLCNFIQLKRANLERHYVEQHKLDKKAVELMGYTVTLFDVENVECVTEDKAVERESEAWKCIEKEEKVIDIDDEDDEEDGATANTSEKEEAVAKEMGDNNKEEAKETEANEKVKRILDLEESKEAGKQEKEKEVKATDETNKAVEKVTSAEGNKEQTLQKDQEATKDSAKKDTEQDKATPASKTQQDISKSSDTESLKETQQEVEQKEEQNKTTQKKEATNSETLENVNITSNKQTKTDYPTEEIVSKTSKQLGLNKVQKIPANKDATIDEDKIKQIQNSDAQQKSNKDKTIIVLDLTDSEATSYNDFEVINEKTTVQDIQDELLALAAEAAEKEEEIDKAEDSSSKTPEPHSLLTTAAENIATEVTNNDGPTVLSNQEASAQPAEQTTMSDLISSSIDMIYKRVVETSKRKSIGVDASEAKKPCRTASNAFMPTRDESNHSPTIQILAQSIINLDEDVIENGKAAEKPMTMAERLSQRFKGLQSQNASENTATKPTNNPTNNSKSTGTDFEQLINDTILELEKEKNSVVSSHTGLQELPATKENLNREKPKETAKTTATTNDVITVISDDEDWEDIEITETAPTTSATNAGNMQKSKNKGLFQKFGMFKGNNTKSKKHLPQMVFIPKKKAKDKNQPTNHTTSSPTPNNTTAKANNTVANASTLTNTNAHLGFKPVINIMDDLLPDSPCNDPIDLVPELAPLEPLQDLNDISSILDSNLSAVNINAADHNTSIEDALDFISEQQANDKQKSNTFTLKSQSKTVINNISHVGYSVQTAGENPFKFYCLLQNCSFLYSSDSIGLETHFMCEHNQVKWNGYCLMCQAHCFPEAEASLEYPITKEIRHMMDKHANKPLLELNNDSTQHSTTSSQGSDERPKIKLRRLTGDCLSRATPDKEFNESAGKTNANAAQPLSMLGALLVAKPKPPTIEMPPQPQMPLTEPLLLDNNKEPKPGLPFRNVNGEFLITSVTSAAATTKQAPLQIASVISLNRTTAAGNTATKAAQLQVPKISNVRTLAPKPVNSLWSSQQQLVEAADESQEVSSILANAGKPSTEREAPRALDDSPVIVAETVPLAQAKTGDFVVTQTVSAQYSEFSTANLGFNISIAASTTNTLAANLESVPSITSRQYKCMGKGCKFVSRVPVAMSDHLRFHERRNFSNKQDYLSCGFCFYCASDIEDYMNHAEKYHIINKATYTAAATPVAAAHVAAPAAAPAAAKEQTDTATSLTKKIQDILNSNNNCTTVVLTGQSYQNNVRSQVNAQNNVNKQSAPQSVGRHLPPVPDTQEVYLKKLRETIDETVGPTGLADDKLYRCVIKSCHTQLTESTFLSHIMFHITSTGGNPNNFAYKCPHCSAQYHRPAGIKAHIKNHARNRFFCYLCDQTSTNPGQLLKHFSEKHWHTLNMYTKELLQPKTSTDGSDVVLDSGYYVGYTQDISDEDLRRFGEKMILEWQRKKSGSKTHFKSTEIDLLPLSAIFQREVNCGECKYKTKVRTNMLRHLQMHKQSPGLGNKSGAGSKAYGVDPVNPVPCLNSSERFFDKMTNLASSSLIPSSGAGAAASATKPAFKIPYGLLLETKCYTCGCAGCNYHTISEDLFRTHMSALHSAAQTYRCTFCQEEICKRGLNIDRIVNHLRFHGAVIYRCEECNYIHYLRYVVERHINERHASLKVNIVTHERTSEDNPEGIATPVAFAGKKYKDSSETDTPATTSTTVTRSSNSESSAAKPTTSSSQSARAKGKWVCDVCGHKAATVGQMLTHCQQQHGVKNQYKCAHCNFGSQQLSQILSHIDDKHPGKTREARYMYHKSVNNGEELADTRPLWQRNDPTRVRHIRGILMEDEELSLTEDLEEDQEDEDATNAEEQDDSVPNKNYLSGYEFGCYHCGFKTQIFEDLKNQHYPAVHGCQMETARPFWYRLHRRLCCPECRAFIGNNSELQQHLQNVHKKPRFYAADVTMAENEDTSQRILCGYCSFHCANVEHLHRHHLRVQHWPQDIRIDNNEQIMDILALGKGEMSYQCTLCADIFPNRVAIVQHACNAHAGEDSFSFRELSNSLIFRCNTCCFTSTSEMQLLRHMIDHYSRFKICQFCKQHQSSFNVYMQHCYAEHRNDIQKFRALYPFAEIRKFLLQMLIVFPSGLVLNKRNLLNTKYGKTEVIDELYEEMYKISQQPPIPRLSIARLVARKSIEAQQKQVDICSLTPQNEILEALQSRPKSILKRRRTVVFSVEDKPKMSCLEENKAANSILKRRTTVDHDNLMSQYQRQQKDNECSAPLQQAKICKRRRTVAVDRETLFSSNLSSNTEHSLLIEKKEVASKKRKVSNTRTPSPKPLSETYPLNLDLEPFSFYGQTPEPIDLTKIHTKVAIGGIKTPLTIDKFKLLFNIDCQVKLSKCDDDTQNMAAYQHYKHIKKACPASHKLRFN